MYDKTDGAIVFPCRFTIYLIQIWSWMLYLPMYKPIRWLFKNGRIFTNRDIKFLPARKEYVLAAYIDARGCPVQRTSSPVTGQCHFLSQHLLEWQNWVYKNRVFGSSERYTPCTTKRTAWSCSTSIFTLYLIKKIMETSIFHRFLETFPICSVFGILADPRHFGGRYLEI